MSETVDVLIDEEKVVARARELGAQISKEYEGKNLHIVGILKGSVFFMVELAKYITVPCTMDFMSVSSYGSGMESSGKINIKKDLDEPIKGKHVLLVEDIIDSGNTLYALRQVLLDREPESFRICTLLDKPDRREKEVPVDYVGFQIPDAFVVGYGLDYDQRYRNLPYIGVVSL